MSGGGYNFGTIRETDRLGSIDRDGDGWFIVFQIIGRGFNSSGGLRKWRRRDMSGEGRREYRDRQGEI